MTRATVLACPLLALRLDAGTGHRARSARLSLAIRRGQRPSPSRCRWCRRDSSGGPPAAPPGTPVIGGPTRPLPGVGGAGPQGELTIESGPDAGHTHRAGDAALRLGRSPDNDLILRDPATSGHHARVERRGVAFWIVDLGSTNGTLVNGEPIQEKELNHGDRITIGQNAVHFSVLGG